MKATPSASTSRIVGRGALIVAQEPFAAVAVHDMGELVKAGLVRGFGQRIDRDRAIVAVSFGPAPERRPELDRARRHINDGGLGALPRRAGSRSARRQRGPGSTRSPARLRMAVSERLCWRPIRPG